MMLVWKASNLHLRRSIAQHFLTTFTGQLLKSETRQRVFYETAALQSQIQTKRSLAIEELSQEIFSRGNVHMKNVAELSALPEGLYSFPEVCFIGKPNVGKSALISCLLHNPNLGRSGRIMGGTRLLKFFNVGDALLLVDTPGYGGWGQRQLAQKQSERANAFAILFRYLALRKQSNLKRVYWLLEASATTPVRVQPRDEEILAFLMREKIPFSVLLTKIDRHWHHYADQSRKVQGARKDDAPLPGSMRSTTRCISTPLEGLQRNIEEVSAFLGTKQIPIIGVSANRRHPNRCQNLTLLQHDIVHYCSQELHNLQELTYANFKNLSYAPPLAEDIRRVQLQYPIESFVVPQDNNLSLEKMVAMHLEMRARCVATPMRLGLLTAKDAEEKYLEASRQERNVEGSEDYDGTLGQELPSGTASGGGYGAAMQLHTVEADAASPWCSVHSHSAGYQSSCLSVEPGDSRGFPLPPCSSSHPKPVKPAGLILAETNGEDFNLPDHLASCSEKVAAPFPCAASVVSLPFSLDHTAQAVVAINGVRIPRSMIPASVEDLAKNKDDELPAFAAQSGAGAYEELLAEDYLPLGAKRVQPFMEHDLIACVSEADLDAVQRIRTCSVAQQQKKRLLERFVDKKRKERSIYMQAEGYMCPWLAGAGQRNRTTVVGLSGGVGKHLGRGGSLMKGLKRTGFGGKSYSAKTLRNRGRATKKTGSWAT